MLNDNLLTNRKIWDCKFIKPSARIANVASGFLKEMSDVFLKSREPLSSYRYLYGVGTTICLAELTRQTNFLCSKTKKSFRIFNVAD